jgi:hypothetical protein
MSLLRIVRNLAALLILALTLFASTPRPSAALFCGGTCNPRYGRTGCPAGCTCYGASTRGVCLKSGTA